MSKFSILSTQNINFTAPLEMGSPLPLDGRTVVQHVADLTNLSTWLTDEKKTTTNVSPGLQVYVTDTHETYQYIGTTETANAADVQKQTSWIKVSDTNTSSDKVLTSITVNNVISNGVTNNNASVTIDSNDIQLGNDYSGKEIKSGTTVVTPASADTVSTAVKKIIDIILDDEKVISASENNLNDHINDLSGKTITEITSKDNTVTLVKGEDAANDTISVDLSVNAETTKGVLGLHYDKDKKTITISSTAGESVPTGDFIKDGMINSVALDTDKKNLVITWNTDAGLQPTTIPLKDFAQIYKFDTEGDTTHNVKFSEVQTSDGQTEIQANVTTIDCGEYEGE